MHAVAKTRLQGTLITRLETDLTETLGVHDGGHGWRLDMARIRGQISKSAMGVLIQVDLVCRPAASLYHIRFPFCCRLLIRNLFPLDLFTPPLYSTHSRCASLPPRPRPSGYFGRLRSPCTRKPPSTLSSSRPEILSSNRPEVLPTLCSLMFELFVMPTSAAMDTMNPWPSTGHHKASTAHRMRGSRMRCCRHTSDRVHLCPGSLSAASLRAMSLAHLIRALHLPCIPPSLVQSQMVLYQDIEQAQKARRRRSLFMAHLSSHSGPG